MVNDAFFAAYDAVLRQWPVEVDSVDIHSDFGTTHIQVCGPEDGPPLVLLHGSGATSTVWFANIEALAATHRVYALDQIGEPGRSVHNGRPLRTTEDQIAWLASVLDHFALEKAHLCGHSSGAGIALNYTVHAPERVAGLALLDPTQCFAGLKARYLMRALPTLVKPNAARLRAFLEWETGGGLDQRWLELASLGAEFPASKMVATRRPTPDPLTVPTLVALAGDSRCHDPEEVARNAGKMLPTSVITILSGVSHHAMPMRPAERLNPLLAKFLTN